MKLYGSTSGWIGLHPPTVLDNTVYTLPATAPTIDGQVLSSTIVGVMSWQTSSGGGGGSVTLVGETYLTESGSVITAHPIDLSGTNVTGTIGASHLPAPTLLALGGVKAIAGVAHDWIYGIDTSGNPLLAQPAFSDISGTVSNGQLANSGITINSHSISLGGSFSLAFSDFAGTVAAIQLPNPSAVTIGGIQSITAATHMWIDSISTSGVPHQSQPTFSDISGTVGSSQGGTGINNGSSTITIGGSVTVSGAFTTTLTVTANTSVILPASGTLLTQTTRTLTFVIDNGGVAIPANTLSAVLVMPYAATVVGWAIQVDQSATVTIDLFKQAYSTSAQPSSNSWVSGAILPSLTTASANKSSNFTSSGTNYGAISVGDQILTKILTNNNATRITVELVVTVNG